MSTVRANSITNSAGSGAPDFPNGLTVDGVSGKPFLGTTQFLTTDATLTSTDDRDLLICSGDTTVTLPAVSEGLVFGFINNSDALVVIATTDPATTVGQSLGGVLLLARQEAIIVCDGANWQIISAGDTILLQTVQFSASGTYVPNPQAKMFLACATGATGGTRLTANQGKGGSGGAGYSEKLYTAPFAASYAVTIGFGGAANGTAGGTTTFDGTISIPSSAGASSSAGTSGATGTGGDFNATGGTGGSGNSTLGGGGGGGSATRAGNGGNGSAGTSSAWGSGGGTGGNDAVGATPGAAATSVSGSAYSLTAFANAVTFEAGGSFYVTPASSPYGAFSNNTYSGFGTTFTIGAFSSGGGAYGNSGASSSGIAGLSGNVTIVEIF